MPPECRKGHLKVGDNLDRDGRCKTCRRERQERRFAERATELFARIDAGDRPVCSRGHVLTRASLDGRGRCRLCKSEADRRRYKPPRGYRLSEMCRNGHLRIPENMSPSGRCRLCQRDANVRRMARLRADPERYALFLEANRIREESKRRKAGVPARNWTRESGRLPGWHSGHGELLSVRPLLEWLSGLDANALCRRAGVPLRRLYAIGHGEQDGVSLHTVDRLLSAAGEEYRLLQLYPLDEVTA